MEVRKGEGSGLRDDPLRRKPITSDDVADQKMK